MNELEIIQHPQIEGLSFFFDTVDYRTAHFHPEWELIWTLDQPLAVSCGQQQYQAAPGEMLLFNPQQPHEFHKVEDSCTFLCLQVSSRLLAQGFPDLERLSVEGLFPRLALSQESYSMLQKDVLRAAQTYFEQQPCYALSCIGQVCGILYRIFTGMPCRLLSVEEAANRDKHNARLARLLEFVDQNYWHKIRLSDFARQEGLSMNYLSAFVREALNQSFQEYVNTVRFHCACKLIAAGELKMLDVCMASGFSDYRYFTRAFRQYTGLTPEQYSRQPTLPLLDAEKVHHSVHSLERFYSNTTSMELLQLFQEKYR